jgi:hypothetical protein
MAQILRTKSDIKQELILEHDSDKAISFDSEIDTLYTECTI